MRSSPRRLTERLDKTADRRHARHVKPLNRKDTIMNAKQLFTAASLALVGTAALAGGEFDPLTGYGAVSTSAAPRVAVAPAAQRAAVERFDAGTAYLQAPAVASTTTRSEVRAEFLRARAEGDLVSFDTGVEYAQAPEGRSTLTREEVRAETRTALRARARNASGS
jgi:hypothetical protein